MKNKKDGNKTNFLMAKTGSGQYEWNKVCVCVSKTEAEGSKVWLKGSENYGKEMKFMCLAFHESSESKKKHKVFSLYAQLHFLASFRSSYVWC